MSNEVFQSKIFTLAILAVIFFFGFSIVKIWPQKGAIEAHLFNLEKKIAETEKSNADLKSRLDYFKSRSYLEREAKLKLNVRRPDENVIFIYEDQKEENMKNEFKKSFTFLSGLASLKNWIKSLLK